MEENQNKIINIEDNERFIKDLEFIQNLSNAAYLHYLARNQYFDDPCFINYLKYLRYWKESKYIIYIQFPNCLTFLDALIDSPKFRKELLKIEFRDFIHQQQAAHWMRHEDDTLSHITQNNQNENNSNSNSNDSMIVVNSTEMKS